MAKRINPAWIKEMKNHIIDKTKSFPPQIISYHTAAQWLIKELADSGLIPKVEQIGAGVKRISVVGTCCPTCGHKC